MKLHMFFGVAIVVAVAGNSFGTDRTWTGAVDSDFFNDANWDTVAPIDGLDPVNISGGSNLPVVIGAGAGEFEVGAIQLGYRGTAGGDLIMNGGTMLLRPFEDGGEATDLEFKSHVGDQATANSSWILNNAATVLYDNPLSGDGLGFDGTGQDLEIGAQVNSDGGGSRGLLELHDDAVLRISDDLKIGAENNGSGEVLVDGNATITVGSGISVTEGANGNAKLTVAGNALVVSGNSAGAGNTVEGVSDEGYLTVSTAADSTAEVTIKESGKMYVRTLQSRNGITTMNIQDNGEFHVFDTFNFSEPDLGTATAAGPSTGSYRTSHLAGSGGEVTITVEDSGIMTVDSALSDVAWAGLVMSGGTNSGGNSSGGKATIEVRDSGNLTIVQELYMGYGTGVTSESILKVVGPDASVNIDGNLNMSVDQDLNSTTGTSLLHAVITGAVHSTVNVGGDAEIDNGELLVEFGSYIPLGGESYTLISADNVFGEFIITELPMLPGALSWDLAYSSSEVQLTVNGLLGDKDGDGAVDAADAGQMFSAWGTADATCDLNSDGIVDAADAGILFSNWTGDSVSGSGGNGSVQAIIPEPTTAGLMVLGLVSLWGVVRRK